MFESIIGSKWAESHGANGKYLGLGMLYFSLAYITQARRCVCLGSGGGFVPKVMVAAQRALMADGVLNDIDVVLVDGNVGPWGLPNYGPEGIDGYPEIRLMRMLTSEAVANVASIDYLHVDADHSYEGCLADLEAYGELMHGALWAISVHDTKELPHVPPIGTYRACVEYATMRGLDMISLPHGAGTTVLMPRLARKSGGRDA